MNTNSKIFPLSNLVLYAKGWYKKTDNIWDDLKKILELDDYSPFNKNDIYNIILSKFAEFKCYNSNLIEVLINIHPEECWKFGYYTKGNYNWTKDDNLPEYDMQTAFIYYVLSTLRFIDNTKWRFMTPQFSKYPMNPNVSSKEVISVFLNKNKIF